MRFLPCKQCGTAVAPSGRPMAIGRLSTNPLVYKCSRCKKAQTIGAKEFNQLPVDEGLVAQFTPVVTEGP